MPAKHAAPPTPIFGPTDIQLFMGLDIPDPITFILGSKWLNQDILFPRQATLMKIIFLRDDLFTDYDNAVIDEWETAFRETGKNGIVPGIRKRIKILQKQEYKWFREVLLVMGRRAGKGHISAQAMAYVLWNYMAKTDPQKHYGIAKNKKLECLIYAGKKEQARKNLWQDLVDAITGSECFGPYISRSLGETLTVFAPSDKIKMMNRRGIEIGGDPATFRIEPKEATLMSGRGGASFMQGYDEMAHVVASGANRSAEEVYTAALPALDQFKKDAFIVEPSSPWQMTGQFYENYQQVLANKKYTNADGVEIETDEPEYPNKMMIQLTSWDIYKDWEIAHTIDVFPPDFAGDLNEYLDRPLPRFPVLRSAPQEYDDEMRSLEQSNPETFAVERLSHWATTQDAYLNPEKIADMWDDTLQKHTRGTLNRFYYGHIDPSTSNANFGFAVAHTERHPERPELKVCVFDYIHHWSPQDFEDNFIDYEYVIDQLWESIASFPINEFTFDQFSAGAIRSMLQLRMLRNQRQLHITPQIHEVTANANLNWRKAENFKTALNQGWIRAPFDEQADLELKFLKLNQTATTMRVEKQETGPVTTKDVADCMFQCVHALLGDQIEAIRESLGSDPVARGLQGGITPFGNVGHEDEKLFSQFDGFNQGAGRYTGTYGFGGSLSPSRGLRRDQAGNSRSGW